MSAAMLDDFGFRIRHATMRVLGKVVSIETDEISAHSSSVNIVTAQPRDYKVVENHPIIPIYGRFRNDPTWDRFMQNIEEYSQEIDAIERSAE